MSEFSELIIEQDEEEDSLSGSSYDESRKSLAISSKLETDNGTLSRFSRQVHD